MSDATKGLQGLPPRKPAADPRRMVKQNRQSSGNLDSTLEHVSDVQTPSSSAEAMTAPAVPPPPPASGASSRKPASASAVGPAGRLNASVAAEVKGRAIAAFQATAYLEGDTSFSEFIERALVAEAHRRELAYNNGEPYAVSRPLRPGRPLKS